MSDADAILLDGQNVDKLALREYLARNEGPHPPAGGLRRHVVDMHYGALKGVAWVTGEPGAKVTYTLSSGASIGATTLSLVAGTAPIDDQLIVVLGTDGEYYCVPVSTVSGTTVNLREPLPVAVNAGANVFNAYDNEPHANKYGFSAIADYALRTFAEAYTRVVELAPVAGSASVVISAVNDNDTFLPSSTNVTAYEVTPDAGTGVTFTHRFKRSGSYLLRLKMNTGGDSVSLSGVISSLTVVNESHARSDASVIEIPFWVPARTNPALVLTVNGANPFTISPLEILEHTGQSIKKYDNKKHVLFGDSWFAITPDGIIDRLRAVLPDADFVNAGVGGNTAADLVNRFDTDVAPHSPDFVWIIVGTNDYYTSVASSLFGFYLQQIIDKCTRIGAIPIVFTPSIGSPTMSTARFNLSRRYPAEVMYFPEDLSRSLMLVSFAVDVANGVTRPIASLGRHQKEIVIYESYIPGFSLDVRYGTSYPAANDAGINLTGLQTDLTITLDPVNQRFVDLAYTNSTGSTQTIQGYIICKRPTDFLD